MWLVKVYEVCPKQINYVGDNCWTESQRQAKRFTSKEEAHAMVRYLGLGDEAVVVRLRVRQRD